MTTAAEPGLLERSDPLDRIEQTVRAAVAGRPRILLVEGDAGIGKTSVLAEAGGLSRSLGCTVLSARGGVLEQTHGYGIVRQLLEGQSQGLVGAAALAAPALGLDSHVDGDALGTMHGLYWLITALADERPAVLLVDDAQWADPESLQWLAFLASRIEGLSLAIIVATRLGEPDGPYALLDLLATQPVAETVRLLPLTATATAALMSRTFGAPVDAALAGACHEQTGGNPWLIDALSRELIAEGHSAGPGAVAPLYALVPDAVARVTRLRLERQSADAVALARALSILGSSGRLHDAAQLAELSDPVAAAAMDELISARLLEADREPRFVHPLVRDVIYDDLPSARRAADHKRAARLLDSYGVPAERIAAHLVASAPAGDPWVVERLRSAAAAERSRGAAAAAASLLARAAEEPPPANERAAVLCELGSVRILAADLTASEPLREALAAPADASEHARAALLLGRLLVFAGDGRGAVDVLTPAVEATPDGDARLMLETTLVAAAHADLTLRDVAADRTPRLRASARRGTRAGRVAEGVLAYDAAIRGESAADTIDLARSALAGGRLVDSAIEDVESYVVPMSMLAISDALDEAEAAYSDVAERLRERGHVLAFATVCAMRSWTSYLRGDLAGAELHARDALALIAGPVAMMAPAGFARGHLAATLLQRGQMDEAAELLGDPERLVTSSLTWDRNNLYVVGLLALADGRLEDASRWLLRCGELHEQHGILNPAFSQWRSAAAIALARLGERERAEDLAARELTLARRFGAARSIGVALRTAGIVAGGADGVARLEESVATLRESPAVLERGESLVSLGAALRRGGQRADARPVLTEGLEIAARCGAVPLAETAREELIAAGSRPRSVLRQGADALTPSERRVAHMAAEGLSNPEIAQRLFITRATVESHLHSAYRKLGIRSREELAGALEGSQ